MSEEIVKVRSISSRKVNTLLLSLLLLYFILNLFFVCRSYSQETLLNCYSVEQFRDARKDYVNTIPLEDVYGVSGLPFDFKVPRVDNFTARPLCGPFYYLVALILKSAGYTGSMIFPLQATNLIFNCLTLVFAYLILLKLSNSRTASILGVLLIAFSFCFWYWGTSVKSYPITTAFLFISVYLLLLSKWHLTFLSGIFMGLAIGFTESMVVFIPVAILMFFLQRKPVVEKLIHGSIFLAVSLIMIIFIQFLFCEMYLKTENLSFTEINPASHIFILENTASSPFYPRKLLGVSKPEQIQMIRTQIEKLWLRFSGMSILPMCIKWESSSTQEPRSGIIDLISALLELILIVIIISSIFFIKKWKLNFHLLLAFLFWVLIPLIMFFFADADNDYTYIAAFGLIFFIAATCSFSKILKFALIIWIGIVALINILVAYPISKGYNNLELIQSRSIAEKIEQGSQLACFDPAIGRKGSNIYLTYYSRARIRLIQPYMIDRFPLDSREVILNQSEFENYPGISENARKSLIYFLSVSGYKKINKFIVGEEEFTLYKRN